MMSTRALTVALAVFVAAPVGARFSSSVCAQQDRTAGPQATQAVPPLDADVTPLTSKNIDGHRLWMIVFDKSTMQLPDMQRAAAGAASWTAAKTPNVDVVAVAVIDTTGLEVLQDFTSNDGKLQRALAAFNAETPDAATARLNADAPDLGALSNDQRLTGLKSICETLKQWPEHKDMLYYTASTSSSGGDNAAQYRDAINACEKAHVTIDTIDAHGLTTTGRAIGAPTRGAAITMPGRAPSPSAVSSRSPAATSTALAPFTGTWQCDVCEPRTIVADGPADVIQDSARRANALWLGQSFVLSAASSSLRLEGHTPQPFSWTFDLSGWKTTNSAPPLTGDWTSTASWTGTSLVLTMTGDVREGTITTTQTLTIVASGDHKGELRVETMTTPAGVLQNSVSIYKKQ